MFVFVFNIRFLSTIEPPIGGLVDIRFPANVFVELVY